MTGGPLQGLGQRRLKRPDACSVMWDGATEAAWGSAALARFWLAVEQSGPWGRLALTQSRLDPAVGRALEQQSSRAGGRTLLIRTVGDHRYRKEQPRRVFLSGGVAAGQPWFLTGLVEDPAELLALPWHVLAGPDPSSIRAAVPALEPMTVPVLLICTNSKRDACCAVRGRGIAQSAVSRRAGQVWECSHCGGHRFAPTGIALPSGHTLARLTSGLAVAALDAAARKGDLAAPLLGRRHNRGLSHLAPVQQAAEAYVRAQIVETNLLALRATASPHPGVVWVGHRDGRTWTLRVEQVTSPVLRRSSCTSRPVPSVSWEVTLLSATSPPRD